MRFNIESGGPYNIEYNAAPTKKLPVIANTASGGLSHFYWGAISKWSNNKSISNRLIVAELSQVASKPSLKNNLVTKRCLVPANGFYMWKKVGKKSKRPYYFSLKKDRIFSFPALWEDYEDMDGKIHHTFKLIISDNMTGLQDYGDKFPLILEPKYEQNWLNNETGIDGWLEMLQPTTGSEGLNFYCVSPMITNISNNFPQLIDPQPSVDQLGNYTCLLYTSPSPRD